MAIATPSFMAVATAVCLLPVLAYGSVRLGLWLWGRYLTAQSADRRDILRALFKRDLDLGSQENLTEVDNGWDKIDSPSGSDQQNWSGIIGFFHPFW